MQVKNRIKCQFGKSSYWLFKAGGCSLQVTAKAGYGDNLSTAHELALSGYSATFLSEDMLVRVR